MAASVLIWAGHTLDVILREDVADAAQIASHPLEDGSIIADHIVLQPTALQAEVLVSDIPADGSAPRTGRADEVYLALLQEMGRGTAATLITGVRAFGDMVLTQVNRSRARPEAAARITVRWDPIRRVSGQQVSVPQPHVSTVAAPAVTTGKVTPEAPAVATETKGSSILASLLGV